jgi:FdrA protein
VEAKRALDAGYHVFLFSDNVDLDDEVVLKRQAEGQGLIVMGPDCGTSLIGGIHFGFVNHVTGGPVGIVAASGTGAQEVSSALSRAGIGISHIIGTGGRDLSAEVGGISARQGLNCLAEDDLTERILLISKPPAESVAKALMQELKQLGKPAAVLFLGSSMESGDSGVQVCSTLGDIIAWATDSDLERVPDVPKAKGPYIRALYVGGTFAYQASILIGAEAHSDAAKPWLEKGHAVVDFGDDKYTLGRPHPMIDGSFRQDAIEETLLDANTGVLVCDVVLGDGAEEDPAGRVVEAIESARKKKGADDLPIVIAHVVGTPLDPQGYDKQVGRLKNVGVYVTETSTTAVQAAKSSVQ